VKVVDFFFAARPMLLLPVWSVYFVSLKYHHALAGDFFGGTDALVLGCLSLLFAGAYLINQVFDYESDRMNRKVGFLQSGLISERGMMLAFLICSVIPLVVAPFVSLVTLFNFATLVVLSYVYSAPPLRLKDRPIGGLLANVIAYGWIVPLTVMPELSDNTAGLLGWDNPFYFLFAIGGVYLLTTVPDVEGDRKVDKKTLAVWLGRVPTVLLAVVFFCIAGWFAYESGFALLFYLAISAAVVTLAALFLRAVNAVLLAAKFPLLLLTLLAGYWYPAYLMFIVALLLLTRLYYFKRFGIVYPKLA
jgi:4-hydroxybenzoate polyprenyltransferase